MENEKKKLDHARGLAASPGSKLHQIKATDNEWREIMAFLKDSRRQRRAAAKAATAGRQPEPAIKWNWRRSAGRVKWNVEKKKNPRSEIYEDIMFNVSSGC